MFSSRIVAAFMAITSVALAMPQVVNFYANTNTTCWVDHIHAPCYGHQNGCTPDNKWLLHCDETSDSMVFKSVCGAATGVGSCHCDEATGESLC